MTTSFIITRKFLRGSHLRRLLGRWWLILIATVLMLPSIVLDLQAGALSGVSMFGIAALSMLILRFSVAWYRQSRSINDWVTKQGTEPVHYRFEEEFITAESVIGKTTLKWNAFRRMTSDSFHVLLEFPRGQGALTVPSEQLAPDALQFLIDRFTENQLPIKNKKANKAQMATPRKLSD